jgi:hypothetical protein
MDHLFGSDILYTILQVTSLAKLMCLLIVIDSMVNAGVSI